MSVPNPVVSRSWAPPPSQVAQPSATTPAVGSETAASLLFESREQAEAAVEGGQMVDTAKLSVEDVPVASRTRTIDAVAVIRLTTPTPLAAPSGAAPPRR